MTASPTRSLTVACARRPRPAALLDDHGEVVQDEGGTVVGRHAAQQHLERSFRRLELEALVLQLLDPLQNGGLRAADGEPQLPGPEPHIAPPGDLAHHHAGLVAHLRGIDCW